MTEEEQKEKVNAGIQGQAVLRDMFSPTANATIIETAEKKIIEAEVKLDYSIADVFDFTSYDDSLRMIISLGWDANKEFYKIKHTYTHACVFAHMTRKRLPNTHAGRVYACRVTVSVVDNILCGDVLFVCGLGME